MHTFFKGHQKEESPKAQTPKTDQTTKGKESLAKGLRGLRLQPSQEKGQPEAHMSKEERAKQEELERELAHERAKKVELERQQAREHFLRQEEKAARLREKEKKVHEGYRQERKERQTEEQKLREERKLHELQKAEKLRDKRKVKVASKKQAMRSRQQEQHLSKVEEEEQLRQKHAEEQRIRKQQQLQEAVAQQGKERVMSSTDPLGGPRSSSPLSSRPSAYEEHKNPSSLHKARTSSHAASDVEMQFINDPAHQKPIKPSGEHALAEEAKHKPLCLSEGAQDSPLHWETQQKLQDLARPPTPSQHSAASGDLQSTPKVEQQRKFREALEKGQRAPLAEEHTDTKAWPPLTVEQQHQPQQPPRVDRPQPAVQAVSPGHFSRVQAQQDEERLREKQRAAEAREHKRKEEAQRKQEQAQVAADKSEVSKALEGLGNT